MAGDKFEDFNYKPFNFYKFYIGVNYFSIYNKIRNQTRLYNNFDHILFNYERKRLWNFYWTCFWHLIDMFYGQTIGINAFAYMITGYIIGQSKENVFKDSYIPSIVFNVAAILYINIYF